MPPAFAEAWDLLLSDSSNINNPTKLPLSSKPAVPSPPNLHLQISSYPLEPLYSSPTTSIQKRTGSGNESCLTGPYSTSHSPPSRSEQSQYLVRISSNESARLQSSNTQNNVDESSSQHERNPDVARQLQSLQRDLNSLQYSSFPNDRLDTQTVTIFQQKLELLTEAVLSTTSSSSSNSLSSSSSSNGFPSSKSSHSPPSPSSPSQPASSASEKSKPKGKDPADYLRCWDSCCGGRQFSNKSNIIRHRRERSGQMGKFRCSFCNAYFSRGSARNAHEANRICRAGKEGGY